MIDRVSFAGTTFNTLPFKFEAGTPHIAGAIGLAAAIDFVMEQDRDSLASHEAALADYLVAGLQQVPGLRLVGEPGQRAGAVSFLLDEIHPQDAATLLDMQDRAAGRPSLRHAADGIARYRRYPARLAGLLQQSGRCRRPAGRPAQTQ